jgi:hypothetical protein
VKHEDREIRLAEGGIADRLVQDTDEPEAGAVEDDGRFHDRSLYQLETGTALLL